MKFRRFLSVLLAFMVAISVSSILNAKYVHADETENGEVIEEPIVPEEPAEPIDLHRVSGVTYSVESLLKALGVKPLEGNSNIKAGRAISYELAFDANGDPVLSNEDDETANKTYKADGNNVEFLTQGIFTVTLTAEDTDEFEAEYFVTVEREITASDKDFNDTPITYKKDVSGYQEQVNVNAENKKTGDSYEVPSVESYINLDYFEYSQVQKIVYYCAPNSTSYVQGSAVTTSNPSFTVSYRGTYSFYILFKDMFTNTMSTDDLVIGEGGWYEKDEDGNQVGEVVIPIFTFVVAENAAPEIVVRASEDAYVNLKYEVESFIITANGGNREYKLYFSSKYFNKDDEAYETDSDYMEDVIANSQDITEDYLDQSSLTFTPDKEGYYYVVVNVVDDYNMPETAMSRAIRCNGESKSVQYAYEPDTLSIIFLSVAGVCFVAIVLLLVIKPKEEQTVEVKSKETK